MEEKLERVKGIEPSYAAWEAAVLPLNYTREGAHSMRLSASVQSESEKSRLTRSLLEKTRIGTWLKRHKA
jgi:hypothetical protein